MLLMDLVLVFTKYFGWKREPVFLTNVIILCFSPISITEAALKVPCEADWFPSDISGTCFRLFNTTVSWEDARTACQAENADLIKIIDIRMHYVIDTHMYHVRDAFWIGLTRRVYDGPFYWLDETEKANYLKLTSTLDTPVCGRINDKSKSHEWTLERCSIVSKFICESRPQPLCPDDYIANEYTMSCIKLHRQKANFTEARAMCQKEGGDLAVVLDSRSNRFFNDQFKQDKKISAYIGINDLQEEGRFRYIVYNDMVNYTNWDKLEPDNKRQGVTLSQNCVVLNYKRLFKVETWHDEPCEDKNNFICEKFSDCKNEQYGMLCPVDCQQTNCGKPNKICNVRTGSCLSCMPGYQGLTCVDKCSNGTYGQDCAWHCSKNCAGLQKLCDHISGKCTEGCLEGWGGDMCEEDIATSQVMLLVALGASVVFLIIPIVVVLNSKRRNGGEGGAADGQATEAEEEESILDPDALDGFSTRSSRES